MKYIKVEDFRNTKNSICKCSFFPCEHFNISDLAVVLPSTPLTQELVTKHFNFATFVFRLCKQKDLSFHIITYYIYRALSYKITEKNTVRNVDVNQRDPSNGKTALHYACMLCRDSITFHLMEIPGIDENLLDNDGLPASTYSKLPNSMFEQTKSTKLRRFVIRKSKKLFNFLFNNVIPKKWNICVFEYIRFLRSLLVDEVQEQKLIRDIKDEKGNTLLHYAVKIDDDKLIRRILSIDSQAQFVKNNKGKIPIQYCKTVECFSSFEKMNINDYVSLKFRNSTENFFEMIEYTEFEMKKDTRFKMIDDTKFEVKNDTENISISYDRSKKVVTFHDDTGKVLKSVVSRKLVIFPSDNEEYVEQKNKKLHNFLFRGIIPEKWNTIVFRYIDIYWFNVFNEAQKRKVIRDIRDEKGNTLLHYAAKMELERFIDTIISLDSESQYVKNYKGKLPIQYCKTIDCFKYFDNMKQFHRTIYFKQIFCRNNPRNSVVKIFEYFPEIVAHHLDNSIYVCSDLCEFANYFHHLNVMTVKNISRFARDLMGNTLWHLVAKSKTLENKHELYEMLDISIIDCKNNLGNTALHLAESRDEKKQLLNLGAHPDCINYQGRTAIQHDDNSETVLCSLQCIAARKVKSGKIPYSLKEFVEMHHAKDDDIYCIKYLEDYSIFL